MSSATIIY